MAERRASSSFGRARQGNGAIGDFEIGSEIGKGSFAQVYYGWHKVRPAPPSILHSSRTASCLVLPFPSGLA